MTRDDIVRLVLEVECPPFELVVGGWTDDHLYVQAQLHRRDAQTGEWGNGRGGKYLLSEHMVKGEVVKKCFVACRDFAEHEVREAFRWRGRAILGPHVDIDALWEIAQRTEARVPVGVMHRLEKP